MIDLYTDSTPNGHKVSIMLEELGAEYEVHHVKIMEGEQKEDWFLEINPNGRIPAIRDQEEGLTLFESGAILIYLADKFGKFLAPEGPERWKTIQWVMFQMSGIGPMQGQANVFYRYAPEEIEYAIERYQSETRRLYEVLDGQLEDNEYIAGANYTIADIATWPWIRAHEWAGVEIEDLDNLRRWFDLVADRAVVQRGVEIPEPLELDEEGSDEAIEGVRGILA